jgi:hypothetical protein
MRTVRIAALSGVLAASALGMLGLGGNTAAAHASPAITVAHGNQMFGDPAAAAQYWRRQHDSDCAEMAMADVIGQVTGREPTEQQIDGMAEHTPSVAHPGSVWQPGGATDNQDQPVLLARYGVRADTSQSNIAALEQDLAQGRKVIVGVNSATLWNTRGNRSGEDHSVVLTGIDTKAGVVHLNDSGSNTGRDEQVPLATFEKSWATSQNFAVVTR